MRVLLTADTVGGVWTYARELATGLSRRGIQVTLVSFGHVPEPRQMEWTQCLRNLDYRPTAFRLEWMQDSAADSAESSAFLLNVIRETRPDILHLNQFCYGALQVDLPKIVVAHSDVISWWSEVRGEVPPGTAWMRWYRETVLRGLSGASVVVAPSRWMLSQVEKHYGRPQYSRVIYNGRNPRSFNAHGCKDNFILTVGRLWDAAKQVSLLAGLDCGLPVVIAGATEHPDEAYRGDAREIVCEGMVELKGSQTPGQLRSLFADAAIYVAASRYEPFGLAPVEAALSRCAIVANDIPTFRELWGEAACYFQANDAGSLRETLASLRSDARARRHFAELAYQRACGRFTADLMLAEYLDLYESVCEQKALAA